jgi:DNA-binding transcriptional LysR family regulator
VIEDWDDLRVFLALARQGKLSAVAKKLGVSHPTVSRRVKKLEAAVGAPLFDRLPDRFVLTAAGEGLLGDVEAMEEAAAAIHRRTAGLSDPVHGTVRISAGEALTGFLARHLPRLRHKLNCIEFELVATHTLANLSRREADLMIREKVPDLASIVTRKLGEVAYAVYAAPEIEFRNGRDALKQMTWIGFDEEHAYMPGQAWLHALLDGKRPAIRSNDWQIVHEAARAGAGLAVLPCYLADGDPKLRRIGAPLKEVVAEQWLLVHRDLRALPRVRAVMDAIIRLFHDERALLEGRAPSRRLRPSLRVVS